MPEGNLGYKLGGLTEWGSKSSGGGKGVGEGCYKEKVSENHRGGSVLNSQIRDGSH